MSRMPVSGMSLPMTAGGIAFVSFSPMPKGKPSTRLESLSACLALIVPYVTICATRSSPYLSVTYLMTSPRRRSSKSTSKSGIETRSGVQEALEDERAAAGRVGDPHRVRGHRAGARAAPGADADAVLFDQLMKSATTRKYPGGKPIWLMTRPRSRPACARRRGGCRSGTGCGGPSRPLSRTSSLRSRRRERDSAACSWRSC